MNRPQPSPSLSLVLIVLHVEHSRFPVVVIRNPGLQYGLQHGDKMDLQPDNLSESKTGPKPPVVRGARACTTCRAAKMKCVGAEDGQKQCQRCKRANVECIFEKHRRGRKPGSKLSEASKMLRRLEKGLINAKRKSQSSESNMLPPFSDPGHNGSTESSFNGVLRGDPYASPGTHFPSNELPPLNLPHYANGPDYPTSSSSTRTVDMDDDDDDPDRNNEALFPAKMIRKENQRNSFFRTILNPEDETVAGQTPTRGASFSPPQSRMTPVSPGLNDPISAGIIDEEEAKVLFDALFIRLNPFINLFDPALHSVTYVRSRCPFLFSTLIMAACRFFRPELFKQCQKIANDYAVQAFAQAWKSVEVVQAFCCLTYWRDPDDNRTWTYIGYACRMAIELGLNRYVPVSPPHETEFQMRERRNRERTYLVLFVHDRSLSTQTGRSWMLPEDALVRHSSTWHEQGGSTIRPEDVIVSAFVQLRHIAAETTDIFHTSKTDNPHGIQNDIKYEVVLRNCNNKLSQWMDTWQREMHRAGGESFHFSFLSLFRLYIRLFLNSFGIQDSVASGGRSSPSVQALSTCYSSAMDALRILSQEFADMSMLRYGQDTITIMSAYSAVFLLKLLRSSSTYPQLHDGAASEIHAIISKTADSYHEASTLSPASTLAAYHARFLRSLLTNDLFNARRAEKGRYETPIDPRLQDSPTTIQTPPQGYPPSSSHEQNFHFPASPHLPAHPVTQDAHYASSEVMRPGSNASASSNGSYHPSYIGGQHTAELDAQYWKNMFLDLGFGGNVEQAGPPQATGHSNGDLRSSYDVRHQHQAYHITQSSHPSY